MKQFLAIPLVLTCQLAFAQFSQSARDTLNYHKRQQESVNSVEVRGPPVNKDPEFARKPIEDCIKRLDDPNPEEAALAVRQLAEWLRNPPEDLKPKAAEAVLAFYLPHMEKTRWLPKDDVWRNVPWCLYLCGEHGLPSLLEIAKQADKHRSPKVMSSTLGCIRRLGISTPEVTELLLHPKTWWAKDAHMTKKALSAAKSGKTLK